MISFAAAMDACKEKPVIVQELLERMKANEVKDSIYLLFIFYYSDFKFKKIKIKK